MIIQGTFKFKRYTTSTLIFLSDDRKSFLKLCTKASITQPHTEVIVSFEEKVIDSTGDKLNGTIVVQCANVNETVIIVKEVEESHTWGEAARVISTKVTHVNLETISLYCCFDGILFFKDFDGNNCKVVRMEDKHKISLEEVIVLPFEVS